MKITCVECGRHTSSFTHTEKDSEGIWIRPVCWPCLTFLKALALA